MQTSEHVLSRDWNVIRAWGQNIVLLQIGNIEERVLERFPYDVHRERADDGPVQGSDVLLHIVGLNALLRRRLGSLHLQAQAMVRGAIEYGGKRKRAGGREKVCGR